MQFSYSGTVKLLMKILITMGIPSGYSTINDWRPRAYPIRCTFDQMRDGIILLNRLCKPEEIRSQEARVTCKDGSEKILEIFGTPIGDKLLVIFSDVTQRKETEDALKIALKNLNLLQSVTRHDILNQLTILLGFLSVTKTYQVCEEVGLYVDRSIKAAENIRQQILFTRNIRILAEVFLHGRIW